jgi:hypothetical protein
LETPISLPFRQRRSWASKKSMKKTLIPKKQSIYEFNEITVCLKKIEAEAYSHHHKNAHQQTSPFARTSAIKGARAVEYRSSLYPKN